MEREFNMQEYKIGDKVVCTCKDLYPKFNEILCIVGYDDDTKQYTLLTNTGAKTIWSSNIYPNDFKLYKGEPVFKKDEKYYINVQKYALYAGITLKQAHEEIQKWLHDLGIWWGAYYDSTPRNVGACFLCITGAKRLGWTDSMSFCTDEGYIEVEFTRKQSVERIKEDLVEFNGKKYSKDKLAKALKLIGESN